MLLKREHLIDKNGVRTDCNTQLPPTPDARPVPPLPQLTLTAQIALRAWT